MHSADTAGVMEYLFNQWIPESLRTYISFNLSKKCSDREKTYQIASNYCLLLALLHDIGKMTPAFQYKITRNIDEHQELLESAGIPVSGIPYAEKSPHNIAGQAILEEYGFSHETALIIGAHHGKPSRNADDQIEMYPANYFGKKSAQKQQWKNLWKSWIDVSLQYTEFSSVESVPVPDVKLQMLLTGLLIMADWIASNSEYFPPVEIHSVYDEKQYQKRIRKGLNAVSLPEYLEFPYTDDFRQMFEERFSTSSGIMHPNTVQQAFMEIVSEVSEPGIYILEAPMGIGKTEAALAASEILGAEFGFGGIYFGLPTQATANGVFKRIYNWAENLSSDGKHTIRLAHGMADLNDSYQEIFHGKAEDSGDENILVHEWFEGRKQALLSDFVIATVDQFLLASLKQRHVMLRHLGLVGKVVIIDECHAYDAYMNVYLDKTLTWMGAYHVPVIILSATLPPKRRMEMLRAYLCFNPKKEISIQNACEPFAYPVITWTDGKTVRQKYVPLDTVSTMVQVQKKDSSELIALLSNTLSDGGCAAVIVNTVDYAQQLSKEIAEAMPEYSVICFHSRFISTDRTRIENEIFRRVGKNSTPIDRNKYIVVGTQVMEQSLDVDFDFMITELCPMDLLLQRAGRLHRHHRNRPEKLQQAKLIVLFPDAERRKMTGEVIYTEWILQKTEEFLPEQLKLPDCIPELVSNVYAEPTLEKQNEAWQTFCLKRSNKINGARKYCIQSDSLNSSYYSLEDFLNNEVENNARAEASVRDTAETIEVIALQKISENQWGLLSKENAITFSVTSGLSEEEAKMIARQKLKLPYFFSHFCFGDTIKALTALPERWRDSAWLKDELFLLFDENFQAELLGKVLHYSEQYGLFLLKDEQG